MKILALLFALVLPLAAQPYPLKHQFTRHGTGLPDVQTHPAFKLAAPLPASNTDLESTFSFTNQGGAGACGAFSGSEAYSSVFQIKNGKPCRLSEMDIYAQARILGGTFPQDSGVSNSDLIKAMLNGAVLYTTWPYDYTKIDTNTKITPAITAERANHRSLKGYSLDKGALIDLYKQCIVNLKVAPIAGTYWYANQFSETSVVCKTKDAAGKAITVTRHVMANPKGKAAGGHDIPIIAYDDNMVFPNGDVGGVEFHNHWANDSTGKIPWGDVHGSCWTSYKFLANRKYVDDPVVVVDGIVTP